jgi:hypothetical protein
MQKYTAGVQGDESPAVMKHSAQNRSGWDESPQTSPRIMQICTFLVRVVNIAACYVEAPTFTYPNWGKNYLGSHVFHSSQLNKLQTSKIITRHSRLENHKHREAPHWPSNFQPGVSQHVLRMNFKLMYHKIKDNVYLYFFTSVWSHKS